MTNLPNSLSPEDVECVESVLAEKPFDSVNPTQCAFLEQGGLNRENTLLVAETGNGKTLCAEFRVQKALADGDTVAYLVPSKQLTSGKFDSLTEWLDTDRFDIRNATWSEQAGYTSADVIVATFESYWEAVLRGVDYNLDLLVFDDFHELYSGYRGDTIEQGIAAALSRGAEVFACSATVGNPDEIARWMDANLVISPEDRGVPITEFPVELDERDYGKLVSDVIHENSDKGPFIVFNYQKSHTESRAKSIAKNTSFSSPETDYREQLKERLDTSLTDRHKTILNLMDSGVAFHHADLDQQTKSLVEEAVKAGDIQCVSATTTLAYGFDAPVHSVIVADLKRGWGFNEHFVGKWEYVQWVGRAGRDEDLFDEAYAFPLYGDEDAADVFEFGTPVEEKSLESIASHLGVTEKVSEGENFARQDASEVQQNFRWLILELLCAGRTEVPELLSFVQQTLYWHQLSQSAQPATAESVITDPGKQELLSDVVETADWLVANGFAQEAGGDAYAPTDVGRACFEYRHSTWVETSLSDLISLVEWVDQQDTLTPEELLQKLAETYYQCELGVTTQNEQFRSLLAKAGMDPDIDASHTAGIVAWYWCAGIPIDLIEDQLDIEVPNLSTTARRNLGGVVNAVSHLIEATSTTEPPWLDTLADQVKDGVTPPDLYLTNVSGVARRIVTNLEELINQGMRDIETETAMSAPLLYKILERRSEYDDPDEFAVQLRGADQVGVERANTIVDAIDGWSQSAEREHKPPFQTSAREFMPRWRDTNGSTDLPSSARESDFSRSGSQEYENASLTDFN